MNGGQSLRSQRLQVLAGAAAVGIMLASCGGGTGTEADSGPEKTYLRVEASDADGDALQYQWRVTAGRIENRNSNETVWTLPEGPGLHFAYVMVSDGKGGYVEQQYAVSSDALDTPAPVRPPVSHTAPAVADFTGSAMRLRFISTDDTSFTPPGGGTAVPRQVYLPDAVVQVIDQTSGDTVFSGVTDLTGEVSLPKLRSGDSFQIRCSTSQGVPIANCDSFTGGTEARIRRVFPVPAAGNNLRLFGHIGFADGGVCGTQNDYFALQRSASVQVQLPDGTVLSPVQRVNRFGDYAIDAAVPALAALKLQVRCDGYSTLLDVPAPGAGGYASGKPVELSHQLANSRPRIVKMVASGPDGNVRGRMIVPLPNVESNSLPGSDQFLAFKGKDTPLSACMYYRAIGAVGDCDAQGRMIDPITLDDWERQHQFKPHNGSNVEVSAKYINQMDLNLVRFMRATQTAPDNIAFVVCNHPGPDGQTQEEVDEVMATALAAEREVACVAMEWSTTPGVNGGQPFTKFLTFAPDGSLLPSVNLDGRGEKYMPGTCVACHGGTQYNGKFPEKGNPSPYLGSGFLAFDTGNYLFSSDPQLGEAAQSQSIHDLNQLVRATEANDNTPTSRLIQGWYAGGGTTLNKAYVPAPWQAAEAQTAGAARFYREVIGASCRTCHVSMGPTFDWDSTVLTPGRAATHVCGGTADIATNASMPNALISRDRVAERVAADPALAALMTTFLGCSSPLPDPVYPKR
ncbi:MAG: hypothetical protein KF788_00435 [Piscinibacter sp.]|nr:hypothetical protein [Piscinibacter sp.]